jgi:Transposase domain (DUF772)
VSRLLTSQLSFADLELQNQGVHLDPVLQRIAGWLDEHSALVERVRQDLERGLKRPHAGRHGIAPSQVLRSLVLMRVKNWDYRELRERVNDGFTLRSFTQFDSHPVPLHEAFNRAFNRLTPATLAAINLDPAVGAHENPGAPPQPWSSNCPADHPPGDNRRGGSPLQPQAAGPLWPAQLPDLG